MTSIPTSLEDLIAEAQTLSAEDLIRVFRALGMSRIGSDHHVDCMTQHDSGIRCNCVPDEPTWTQPKILTEYFGESWDQRLAKAKAKHERFEAREREAQR